MIDFDELIWLHELEAEDDNLLFFRLWREATHLLSWMGIRDEQQQHRAKLQAWTTGGTLEAVGCWDEDGGVALHRFGFG